MSDAEIDDLIASEFDEAAFFNLDQAVAWEWGQDFMVGMGDGVWDAITLPARLFTDDPASLSDVRQFIGIGGSSRYDSMAYESGSVGGNVVGSVATGGAVWTRAVGAKSLASPRIGHRGFTSNRKNGTWNTGKHRFGWSGSVGSNRYELMYRIGPAPHRYAIPITRVYR